MQIVSKHLVHRPTFAVSTLQCGHTNYEPSGRTRLY